MCHLYYPGTQIAYRGKDSQSGFVWDFQIFWDGRGSWAWPEWVGSMKLGFSDGLGQVLTI